MSIFKAEDNPTWTSLGFWVALYTSRPSSFGTQIAICVSMCIWYWFPTWYFPFIILLPRTSRVAALWSFSSLCSSSISKTGGFIFVYVTLTSPAARNAVPMLCARIRPIGCPLYTTDFSANIYSDKGDITFNVVMYFWLHLPVPVNQTLRCNCWTLECPLQL